MAYEVGDWTVPTLTVAPSDLTTSVALLVVNPETGVETALTPTTGDGGTTWTAPAYEFTVSGEWIERWTVTGTGKGKERRTNLVAPDPVDAPTGQRVYATTTDYALWLRSAPPAGARRALAAASEVVNEMLVTAVYDVDDDGLPTDAAYLAAVRDATCAQAEYARAGADPNLIGAGQPQSFTLGSLSVSRGGANTGSAQSQPRWSPRAWGILQRAGLANQAPWSY